MNPISVTDAFGLAPPRSPCVLCMKTAQGFMIQLTEWFTWLNLKHNPMLSFSMPRGGEAAELREGDVLLLSFPPEEEALRFRLPVYVIPDTELPAGTIMAGTGGFHVPIPKGSETVLDCTLSGAYNYPFKKVRIFNCNLELALGLQD